MCDERVDFRLDYSVRFTGGTLDPVIQPSDSQKAASRADDANPGRSFASPGTFNAADDAASLPTRLSPPADQHGLPKAAHRVDRDELRRELVV